MIIERFIHGGPALDIVLRVRVAVLFYGSLRNRWLFDHLLDHWRILPLGRRLLGRVVLPDLVHPERLLNLGLPRLFNLYHHLKLRVVRAPLVLAASLLQERILKPVGILLGTLPKLEPILRIIERIALPAGDALPPG